MKFGLQKLTLLDYPGKVACTLFVPGCNFRCPFCHNASFAANTAEESELFSEEEILSFVSGRAKVLDGICVTGGEPLMQPGLLGFLAKLADAAKLPVKLDTNGSFPERLAEAVAKKLVTAVAMDVKNSPEKYDLTSGSRGLAARCAESIEFLKQAPLEYCEFRTTVVQEFHTCADLLTIASQLQGASRYFLQKFVDSGHLLKDGCHAVPDGEMRNWLEEVKKVFPAAELRGI